MSDPVQIEGAEDGNGLARGVAELGRAVAGAMAELQRITEHLAEVQTEGRATAERARSAEVQATEAIIRTTELMEQLEQAHRELTEAGERASAAERRAADAEHFLSEAEQRVRAAEERARAAEQGQQAAAERVRAAEERVGAAEERMRIAEERSRDAERRAAEIEQREHDLQQRAGVAEQRLAIAEQVRADAEARAAEAERRATEAERRAADAEAAARPDPEADRRAAQAEERLSVTAERSHLLEEQVADLQTRLEAATHRLEAAEREAAEREATGVTLIVDRERSALQEAVAAEVRRPLTSILGLALALKHHDPGSTDGREMVRQLGANARKLDRLVNELVDLDKLVDGSLQPARRRTDLEALVRRVVEEIPDLANREVFVQAEHVAVTVDPILTEQIVESLLSNAGRRTAAGDTVWVQLAPEGEGALIAVDDDGSEIPGGIRRSALDALRDDADQPPQVPTGLALVTRLAQIQGGRAWIQERPGGGTSFRVFLPDASARGATAPEDGSTTFAPSPESHPDRAARR